MRYAGEECKAYEVASNILIDIKRFRNNTNENINVIITHM